MVFYLPGAAELEVVVLAELRLHVLALAKLGRVLRHEQFRECADQVRLLARDDRPQRKPVISERLARLCLSCLIGFGFGFALGLEEEFGVGIDVGVDADVDVDVDVDVM